MNSFKNKIIRAVQHIVFALLASFVLVSCGGGGGSSSATQPTATATMKAGTVAVGSREVGTSVNVSNDSAGQTVLTVQSAGSKLVNAQAGQVMVFEASSAMPLGFAGTVQSVQTTTANDVSTTTVSFVPAGIGDVFQDLNLNMSNVATNPQIVAGMAIQNGVHAYTKTEPKPASGLLEKIQNGLLGVNPVSTNTAVGVDFSTPGIQAAFWKVNGLWVSTDPGDPLAPKVNVTFTGTVELQNPDFSQANVVIQNGQLVTHQLQLQGTLKRNIKATVTGANFDVNAGDLAGLFSGATSVYNENNGYNEYSFDYKGVSIKVHGVEKDPSKIILGAAIISADAVVPTYGATETGDVLKAVPIGMVVTFFMTADMNVQATTASLGYQWHDTNINAGMGISYDDSLGLPVSLLTGKTNVIPPFWDSTPYLNQPEGVSYAISGSASTTLTAGIDGGIVLAGLEIAQATVEGGIRGNIAGNLSQPVGGTLTGCYSNATVTAGIRALLDVEAGVDIKTNISWLPPWWNQSVSLGYPPHEFPMFPTVGVDWLSENTIWSAGSDTCHTPQFSASAGTALYSYNFDASATGYQPMVTSYTWDFGDSVTATGVTATHTYSSSGSYTVTLTVLYTDLTQQTTSQTISVATVLPLSPTFTVNLNGLQANFDASTSTPSADIMSYSWSFGDSATANGVTATHTYAAYSDTPWSVTLSVTDSYGRTASTSQNVSTSCPTGQVLQNGQCVTPTPTSTLNDTGITSGQCYQAGSDTLVDCGSTGALALNNAQDGMTGRDANGATNSNTDGKLGFSYTAVPAAGSDTGGCVLDNVTGLMWEVKTTDGGLRDWNNTYTNYSPTYDPNLQYGTATDASGFVTAVNATNLCGYSDWRLPTADELLSTVDYSVSAYDLGPRIDTTWFPNTQKTTYWSGSSDNSPALIDCNSNCLSWAFQDGTTYVNTRSISYYVRLVRAGQSQSSRYTLSADGQEVTDNQTKLIWRRCAEGLNWDGSNCTGGANDYITLEAALQDAAVQASSTGKGWRLPNIKELSSIADKGIIIGKSFNDPAIDPTIFPATPAIQFWSSTPLIGLPNIVVWGVNFDDGSVTTYSVGGWLGGAYVRLVRDAP